MLLEGTPLWCDSEQPRPLCFVSRATGRRWPDHRTALVTPETLHIQGARVPPGRVLPCPLFRPFRLGALELELLPAGSLPGAAQIRVEHGGRTTVYANGVRMGRPVLGPAVRVSRCDELVLAGVRPGPAERWPDREARETSLLGFVARAHHDGVAPVLLVDGLGVAQELLQVLAAASLTALCHDRIVRTSRRYADLGVATPARALGRTLPPGHALVWPADLRESPVLRRAAQRQRLAAVGEDAVRRPDALRRSLRVAHTLPWSMRSGAAELLTYVALAEPRRVVVIGPEQGQLVSELRRRGIEGTLWRPSQQGSLSF